MQVSYRLLGELLGVVFWVAQCVVMYNIGRIITRALGFNF